ncbi:unnamed protein product [Rotaria socialis]|uniref:Uncharacterized protein n=1 Tax=Rotaria socialis TaxID=392032 RepID=A0A818IWR3_9BILA|nr:unnamed protein product [Rotaria socialis]CAF4808754.1 unnamed protein product [Rotaria socialis]
MQQPTFYLLGHRLKGTFSFSIKRWLFHYLPLIFCIFYLCIFYNAVVFIPSYDDGILPNLVIAACSMALLIRVIWNRHIRLHQSIQWQKYWKLTIQMLSLSIVFIIFNLPFLIYAILQFADLLPPDINPEIYNYLIFLTDFCILLLPFITIISLPSEFWVKKWHTTLVTIIHRNTVVPSQSIRLATMQNRQTQLH